MNPISIRRANIAVACAIIVVVGYVATLLVNNYITQKRYVGASQKRFLYIFEKQVMAIGYFFSEREQDLRELSNSKEVSTYFENKALGMSFQYGLTTSLMEMQQRFTWLSRSRKIGEDLIYNWIAFVQPDGIPITEVLPNGSLHSMEGFKRISNMDVKSMDLMLEKKGNKTHVILTVPYYFKNRFSGHIAADVPLSSIFDNLVDAKNISEASKAYIFCSECGFLFPEDEMVTERLLAERIKMKAYSGGAVHIDNFKKGEMKSTLIYAQINHTSFWLTNMFPEDEFAAGVKPRDTMLALLLLSILIFGGVGLTIRSNIQKRLLAHRYEESRRNADAFQRQNAELSTEMAERKKAERALEKTNKELEETSITLNYMLKSATEFAIAAIDADYRIIHFNPAAEKILDVNADEVMGRRVLEIHSLRNVKNERFESGIATAKKDGKYEYDIVRKRPERGDQHLHAVVMPMYDDGMDIVGYIFFAIDTTIQYQSEEKLQISEEKYRTLIENMPDIVFSIDEDFTISDINLPRIQTYGLTADHIIGMSGERFIHKDDRKIAREIIQMDLDEKKKYRRGLRFRIISGDGGIHWVDLSLHYQYNDDGIFFRANGVLRDITEQKLLESQLIRTERLAAAGQLAASIAHEINSPLAGISALLALVRKKNLEDKVTLENIDLIRQAFRSIGNTVQNLLDVCRPGLETSQKIDINNTIQKTVALSNAYLKKKGIRIELELSPAVPPFDCHPQEISQVFLNLINNTVEAMEIDRGNHDKKILIRTRAVPDKILIEYMDTGPGISSQYIDKIFDPFFTRKKTRGIGIGLSICHVIVSRNNGTIQALSTRSGAHFVIEFFSPQPDTSLKKIPTDRIGDQKG